MRIVLDSVILVRGLIGPYTHWGNLIFDRYMEYCWIVSVEIVAEYLDVLNRPELTRKYRNAANRNMEIVLALLADAKVVEISDIPPICRDPGDDKFLAAAREGDAMFIVTEDQDLLSLRSYGSSTICTAEAFLQYLDWSVS